MSAGQHPSCLCNPPAQQILDTAGEAGTVNPSVHVGRLRPESRPRAVQLTGSTTRIHTPSSWELSTSLACTEACTFSPREQCLDDPLFNPRKNSLKDAGWHLFFLRKKQGQRSSVTCPESYSLKTRCVWPRVFLDCAS